VTNYKFILYCDDYLECSSCKSRVPLYPYHRDSPINQKGWALLCEICANSFIGNHYLYDNYEVHEITGSIANVGNRIRLDLGAFKEKETIQIDDYDDFMKNPKEWFAS